MKASEIFLAAAEYVEKSSYGACYAISRVYLSDFPPDHPIKLKCAKDFKGVFDHSGGEFAYFMGPTRLGPAEPQEIKQAYQRRVYALLFMAEISKDQT